MNPSVDVIVPWRGGCAHRERVWAWLQQQYADALPQARVVQALAPEGAWCKGRAVAQAAAASSADIAVVADADVWCDDIAGALVAVEHGAPWAVPHDRVHRLTPEGTDAVLDGAHWSAQKFEQRPYTGLLGGGLVVLPREVLNAIPIDPRFEGWGQEDESWGAALYVLLGRPPRGTAPLVHLWHPPQDRLDRRRGSYAGWALRRRYVMNYEDPQAMTALIEEAHEHLRTTDPDLHAPPARAERGRPLRQRGV